MALKIIAWTLLLVCIGGSIFSNCAKSREKRAIISKTAFKWPSGIVPYYIDVEAFNGEEVIMIQDAINTWNMETCVHFRLKLDEDSNWVKITGGTKCHSFIGARLSGEQVVNLASPSCSFYGTYLHELGHVIGLYHEHVRPSRDHYLPIKKEKIKDKVKEFYDKISHSEMLNFNLPYDLQSIMHYGSQSFINSDGQSTIESENDPLDDLLDEIHQKDLSFYDAKVVNLFYECSKKCERRLSCRSEGYVDQFCKCHTPESFESRRCYDKMETEWCITKQEEGDCQRKSTYMSVNCRKTCDRCFKNKPKPKRQRKTYKNIKADSKCQTLAKNGECSKNPSYMKTKCKKSCLVYQVTSTADPCLDRLSLCKSWFKSNKCYRDYHFMYKNCRRSCKFCGHTESSSTSDPVDNCKDVKTPSFCNARAKDDNCQKDLEYMRKYCPETCGFCSKLNTQMPTTTDVKSTCSTTDVKSILSTTDIRSILSTTPASTPCKNVAKDNKCKLYKKAGDCIKHPDFMFKKCFKTCGNCNDFNNNKNNSLKMCTDIEPEHKCRIWQREFKCKIHVTHMAIKCPKTCQFCKSNKTSTGCRNLENDKDCHEWSKNGNCSRNAKFMMVQCGKSCRRCRQNNYTDCQDLYGTQYCQILKAIGKCSTDPFFMLQKCSKTCGSCDLLGKNISHFICSNVFDDQFCNIWKNDGECQNNPKFMLENCGKSCGICKSHYDHMYGESLCESKVKSICVTWKLKGFCQRRPQHMNNVCPKVCDGCKIRENSTKMVKRCNNFYNHKICDKWKATRECEKNPVFMKSVCKKSCGFCEKCKNKSLNCPNLHNDEECKKWAKEKKCETNSFYMLRMCSKSCKNCTVYVKSIKEEKVCKNKKDNKLCDLWSRTMACTKNPEVMLADCAKSCGFCHQLNPCVNKFGNIKCKMWRENGECKDNPKFMMKNCAKTCGNCQVTPVPQTILPTTPSSFKNNTEKPKTKLTSCENIYRDDICEKWKTEGSCKHNPIFMFSQCRKSCGKCQKILQCQNVYNDETCENWAKEGKCRKNKKFMIMLCMKSCGQCSILNFTIEESSKTVKDRCVNKYGVLSCEYWKEIGECERNSIFMRDQCAKSCGACTGKLITSPIHSLNAKMECKNLYNNQICNSWAKSGYCKNSLSFVKIACSLSCKTCSSLKMHGNSIAPCINTKGDELCDLWKKKGKCQNDSKYMTLNCAKSCSSCNQTIIQAPDFQVFKKRSYSCSNIAGDIQCSYWARQGQCKINVAYMKRFCRKACHHCSTKAEKEMNCTDKYSELKCQIWAQRGECDRNQMWMIENCSRSCLVCQKSTSLHKWQTHCKDNLNCFGRKNVEKRKD